MNLFENLQSLKESGFDKDLIIDMVKDGFETGHPHVDYDEFSQDTEIGDVEAAWEFYNKLVNLGPAGFYEEYADTLEFDPSFVAEYGGETFEESKIIKDDKDIEQVEEASILKDEKDMEEIVEQKIIKDEKDVEQVVEGVEPLTEDFEGSKEMFTKKAKTFAEMVDALAKVISEDELHEFLKNLSRDLDMDVYTAGEPYPYEPDGYFSVGSLDDLDLSNKDDGAEFDWVYEELTNCITKINAKITSVIDELKGKIARLELVL